MARTIHLIGAPMDYGADRRGVDMGTSAIRYAGLAGELEKTGATCVDQGDLLIPRAEERDPDADQPREGNAKFLREVEDVTRRVTNSVTAALEADAFPLVLGGDHSIAIGSMRGASRDADLGAVWFDAHADINTPTTSPSGNVHGMPIAAVLGRGLFGDLEWAHAPRVREASIAYVGLRSVDERERQLVRDSDMTAFTMSDIDERGITAVVEDALEVATAGTDGIHVSLDLDWLDPKVAPGVGTPVRGGVTYREAHSALEQVFEWDHEHDVLRSMDVVEVNPILDEGNETGEMAAELAASAFGKRIL